MLAISVYSATKAAVRSFARGWTLDLKDRKIRVNAISPGPIDTPGVKGLAQNEEQEKQFKAGLVSSVPMGRMGTSDEIAKAVSSSRPMTLATSAASSCSSTAAWRKSELVLRCFEGRERNTRKLGKKN